jgi:alkylhydroperoxidase/carboxymuconolactone decarboxylase family protein YurZ
MNKEKTEKMTTKNNIPGNRINARNKKRVIRKDFSIDNRERNLIYIYNCL